jgi:hypothetical protein
LEAELVMDFPSDAAKNTDNARVVWSLWQVRHKIGLSASFIERSASN